jgi:DNA-binding GntR family transcriptional regulator
VPFLSPPTVVGVLAADLPASEKAYRAVLDAVVSGAAPASSLVSEGEVAAALGMSRTPVRAAFLRLEAEGLLDLHPKRGAVVRALEEAEARDLLDTRLMFETTAVGWLAGRGVPAGLETTLRGFLSEQERALDDDVLGFARADRALHEAVVAAAGNGVATRLFAQTGPRLLRLIHRAAARDAGTRRRFADEHARLVDLVLSGDADGYAAVLRAHVEGGHRGA